MSNVVHVECPVNRLCPGFRRILTTLKELASAAIILNKLGLDHLFGYIITVNTLPSVTHPPMYVH